MIGLDAMAATVGAEFDYMKLLSGAMKGVGEGMSSGDAGAAAKKAAEEERKKAEQEKRKYRTMLLLGGFATSIIVAYLWWKGRKR